MSIFCKNMYVYPYISLYKESQKFDWGKVWLMIGHERGYHMTWYSIPWYHSGTCYIALRRDSASHHFWFNSRSRSILALSWTEHLWQMPQILSSSCTKLRSQWYEKPWFWVSPHIPQHIPHQIPHAMNPWRSHWRQLLLWLSFSLRFPPRSSLFAVWRQLWQSWIDWTAVKITESYAVF